MEQLSDEDFKKLEKSETDLEGMKFEEQETLVEIYRNIIDILKEYCDLKEEYYNIIALWIMGTYFHEKFPSYPYLYLNAMRGSGKTRLLKLITYLANDGRMLNSLTEAVLFRTKGTLAIDEFEGIGRKGTENLRELLNSAYKKGTKVIRFRKGFTKEGEQQVEEEFDVYRPVVIANISGMENVLSDRCITLILEKSGRKEITNLVEIFEHDEMIKATKELLQKTKRLVSLVSMSFLVGIYREWNSFIKRNNTNYTNNTNNTNDTNNTTSDYTNLFPYKLIQKTALNGREMELSFPLLIISNQISEIKTTLNILEEIFVEKRKDDVIENTDISLYDFVSQQPEPATFISIKELTRLFREFLQTSDEWINERWMGKALKRLDLAKESRRLSYGRSIILNIPKAQEKIRMFR